MYIVCMKRITKDAALYPLRMLKTGLVTLWRAFDGMSIQTALKLFLIGLLVLLYLFWQSYSDSESLRYEFRDFSALLLRCDKVSGEVTPLSYYSDPPFSEL